MATTTREDFLKKRILHILKENIGLKRYELRQALGMAPQSDRYMRKLVEELRGEGHLIGSSTKRGYFMCHTKEDLEEVKNMFLSKVKGLFRVRKMLEDAGDKEFNKQLELDLEEAINE